LVPWLNTYLAWAQQKVDSMEPSQAKLWCTLQLRRQRISRYLASVLLCGGDWAVRIRIRIQISKPMRRHACLDPDPWLGFAVILNLGFKFSLL